MRKANLQDIIIRWLFNRLVEAAKKAKIYKKKNLKHPDTNTLVYGYCDRDEETEIPIIWLNPVMEPVDPLMKTFIHELGHAIFPDANENAIRNFETFMYASLTRAQLSRLMKFVPKHYVEIQPEN